MAQPKKKVSASKQGHTRHHWVNAILKAEIATCRNCQAPKLAHRVCSTCGHYNGRLVRTPKVKGLSDQAS